MASTVSYTSQAISGYNSSPPADDGTQVASNQVEWQKHLDKIGDPVKTLAEAINTELVTTFAEVVTDIEALQDDLAFRVGVGAVGLLFWQSALPTAWSEGGSHTNHAIRIVSVASGNGGSGGGGGGRGSL